MKFIEMLRRLIGSGIAISSFKSIFSFDIEFLIVSEGKKNELTQNFCGKRQFNRSLVGMKLVNMTVIYTPYIEC